MNNLAVALLCCALAGCAGSATFSVRPFHDPDTGKMECCQFSAMDWRDLGSISIDATKSADGSVIVHYSATAVGATAPTQAQGAVISNVAGAVSSAAAAAIKLAP